MVALSPFPTSSRGLPPPSNSSFRVARGIHITMGPCRFQGKNGFRCACRCGECTVSSSDFWSSALCENCEHPMEVHHDYDQNKTAEDAPRSLQPMRPFVAVGSTYSHRPDTVRKLFNLVVSQRVVQVRSTPTTGKTVLSRLLFTYIESEQPHYKPIHITWQLHGTGDRGKASWLDFLCGFCGGLVDQDSFAHSDNIIFILDEAQLSYEDQAFWVECIKAQKQETTGPHFILFSSFGSPSPIALKIKGSAPIDLSPQQRVSLLPMTDGVSDLGVCFTFEEVKDVCSAIIANKAFRVHEDVLKYLFTLTNGHPGLIHGLLASLFDREDVRLVIHSSGVVTMDNATKFFDDDEALFSAIEHRIRRSLPQWRDLQNPANKDLVRLLRHAVQNHGVEAFEPEDVPGLEEAYESGFLHATSTSYVQGEGQNLYTFPSLLHHRAVERLLFADASDGIKASLKDLCFTALEKFSPTSLQSHARKLNRVPGATRPEAQYAYELYRCLYIVTEGKCIIHSEYSYTVEGRIDFFLKGRQWGIECVKDGDRMSEHMDLFQGQGAYGSWGIVSDHIILNFCTKPPRKKRVVSELYHIVFDPEHDEYAVLDAELQEIARSQLLRA